MENKEIFRKIDVILLEEQMKSTPTVAVLGASSDNNFIRFNSAPDTKPAYLEKESSMLDVNVFIEQATYYINTGFKDKHPENGCNIHLASLASKLGVQRDERDDFKRRYGIDQTGTNLRNPLHFRPMQLLKVRNTSTHSNFLQQLEN